MTNIYSWLMERLYYNAITYWMDIRILIIVIIDCKWGNYGKDRILSATIKEYIYPDSKQGLCNTSV